MIERDAGILCGCDTFEGERNIELALDALDGAPIKRHLEFAAARAPAAGYDMALGKIAFAPAVDRGVDGEAEGAVPATDRAGHVVVDPGLVAAHIELEYPHRLRRRFGHLLQARIAHRAQHVGDAELLR